MIYYTKHAKERMLLRGITEDMVKNSFLKPDEIGTGYEGKSLIFKKFKNGVIKVVFINKKSSKVIISVIWKSLNKN